MSEQEQTPWDWLASALLTWRLAEKDPWLGRAEADLDAAICAVLDSPECRSSATCNRWKARAKEAEAALANARKPVRRPDPGKVIVDADEWDRVSKAARRRQVAIEELARMLAEAQR